MSTKILYVVNASLASQTGGGRTRIISAAKQSKKHGFIVETLCLIPPFQLVSVIKHLFLGKLTLSAELEGKVHYFLRLPFTRFKWISFLNEWYCGILIAILCWWRGIKILHCHAIKSSIFSFKARKLVGGVKIVADIHGATMEQYMYEHGLTEPDEMAVKIGFNESYVLENADWLIFVSEAMRKHYERKFDKAFEHSTIIPCATQAEGKILNGLRNKLRREHNLEDRLVFCYVGSGETYQLPDYMCRFFKEISNKFQNAFFLIYSHHQNVFSKHLADSEIDSKYYKVDAVDHSEVFNVLQMGDFGFLLRDDSVVNQVSSPTKFAEYCLSGLPVITTEWVGDISDIVQKHNLGFTVNLNSSMITDELIKFIEDVQKNRFEYSERCARFAQDEFSWDAFGDKLANIYSQLEN